MFWGFRLFYLFALFARTRVSFFLRRRLRIWLMLELNFICFVRLLRQEFRVANRNGNLYYFLIQRLGRVFILLRILIFLIWNIKLFSLIFFSAILLKLGSAPFQFWYLKLIQKISWKNIWLLSVWQKFIPLILLKFSSSVILILFGAINVLTRRLSSVKQKKIKKILGLSSLFSLGWVISVIALSEIWLWFILGYGLVLINLILSLISTQLLSVENLESSLRNPINLLVFFLNLLIVRGIPPFIVFYLKILILSLLIEFSFFIVLIYLIISVFIIYIYLIIRFSLLTFLKARETSSKFTNINKVSIFNILLQGLIFTVLIMAFI